MTVDSICFFPAKGYSNKTEDQDSYRLPMCYFSHLLSSEPLGMMSVASYPSSYLSQYTDVMLIPFYAVIRNKSGIRIKSRRFFIAEFKNLVQNFTVTELHNDKKYSYSLGYFSFSNVFSFFSNCDISVYDCE